MNRISEICVMPTNGSKFASAQFYFSFVKCFRMLKFIGGLLAAKSNDPVAKFSCVATC